MNSMIKGPAKPIQWYPGHMAKASRLIREQFSHVDLIIEIRDARIPQSSANPDLVRLACGKPRLIILGKSDKADPQITDRWVVRLERPETIVMKLDLLKDDLAKPVSQAADELCAGRIAHQTRRGISNSVIRGLVAGIPNVGKSTFINRMAGKKVAESADKPGVTKAVTWIKAGDRLALLDTPGILWPKIADPEVGYRLAVTGAVKDEVLPLNDTVIFALSYLTGHYRRLLEIRYKITAGDDPESTLIRIGRARGFLIRGGDIDRERTAKTILKDIRQESLGRISWEAPE